MKSEAVKFEGLIKDYISRFEKKQNLKMEFAVNDDLSGVISFGSIYYIYVSDIIFDIDHDVEPGIILRYIEDSCAVMDISDPSSYEVQDFSSYVGGHGVVSNIARVRKLRR